MLFHEYERTKSFTKTKLAYIGIKEEYHHGKYRNRYTYEYHDQYGNRFKTDSYETYDDSIYFNPINPNDISNILDLHLIKVIFYVQIFLVLLFLLFLWLRNRTTKITY
jgi:hypothetical protein